MNYEGIKNNPGLREFAAPFPPENLTATESVGSRKTMLLVERCFDVVERRDCRRALLHPVATADTIGIDFEKHHIAAGNVSSDFILVVARNPARGEIEAPS